MVFFECFEMWLNSGELSAIHNSVVRRFIQKNDIYTLISLLHGKIDSHLIITIW